jgi:hypothetical protein
MKPKDMLEKIMQVVVEGDIFNPPFMIGLVNETRFLPWSMIRLV